MATAGDIARYVDTGVASLAACACAVQATRATPGASARSAWIREVGGAEGTLFDLASLTKPMTAVAVARSGMDRRTTLGALVDQLKDTESGLVPLELFLAHRAGLVAHLPLFEPLTRGAVVDREDAIFRVAKARRDDARGPAPLAGFAPLYSDLGYILAGVALAAYAGTDDAGDAIARLVLGPLGLDDRLGTARQLEARGVRLAQRAAPTEVVAFRGGTVVGRVHDENAWALTGAGGSGHAGMFGTAEGVLSFGCEVLDALEREPAALDWLVAERAGGTLRAGFDGKSAEGSSAGSRMGPRSFGHLGFTGTSLWIDPDAGVVVVLLTNRVHPTRDNIAIRAARPEVHDRLYERALALRGATLKGQSRS